MNENIQQLLSSGNSHIVLPVGEYKGFFVIDHPCIIEGHNTTLWNKDETVLLIKSSGVSLKNLRIELIDSSEEGKYSLDSRYNVTCENVEIIGKVNGFGGEDSFPEMSKQIKLGSFKPDTQNSFLVNLYSPTESATLSTQMKDIVIEPSVLHQGVNAVRIIVNPVTQNSYIYGDIILKSIFNRRLYISGVSAGDGELCIDKAVSCGISSDKIINMTGIAQPAQPQRRQTQTPQRTEQVQNRQISELDLSKFVLPYILKRGERVYLGRFSDNLRVFMGCRGTIVKMDIDPYVFLLNSSGITSCDDDFIYFGNKQSRCGTVTFNDDKTIDIDLKKVPDHIQRISFVYSIYLPGPNDNFSKVVDPFVTIYWNEKEIIRYVATELFAQTTIIFIEIYKHNGKWKINTIGQGYKEGLKKLCSSYGLIVS